MPRAKTGKDISAETSIKDGNGEVTISHSLTESEMDNLRVRCMGAKGNAYCPYSNFRVGAAVLTTTNTTTTTTTTTTSNTIYTGANVENAAYPVGMCAERVAVGAAIAAGVRPGEIRAVAVASDLPGPGKSNDTSVPSISSSLSSPSTSSSSSPSSFCSPCGMCRQFLAEFCTASVPVIMFDADGSQMIMRMGEASQCLRVYRFMLGKACVVLKSAAKPSTVVPRQLQQHDHHHHNRHLM